MKKSEIGESSSSSSSNAAAVAASPIGSVEFTTDSNGLEKVILRGPRRSSAEVSLTFLYRIMITF